jgi:hypothetical protein
VGSADFVGLEVCGFFARNLRKAADLENAQVWATNYLKQEVDMTKQDSSKGGIQ